jgi:phospholipid/cholesterol/gamma-HCH transport system ATP-binding protein
MTNDHIPPSNPPNSTAGTPNGTQPEGEHPDVLIRLDDLHVSFGPLEVLKGVSLDLLQGQTTVIVGPSGTGKSVLLKNIVGLIRPDRGRVYFQDQPLDTLNEVGLVDVRKKIGFLFQMGALFDSMTVEQNICFPLVEHTDMSPLARRERCEQVLRLVGLGGIGSKMPSNLSGGQRKRVALARAVVLEPQAVLYDEPTTGLDPIRSDVINELIISLGKRLGITNIVVTHDMTSADKIADRMVMLYDGHVIEDGSPADFYRSDSDLVQRFIHGRADELDLQRIHQGFEPAGADATEASSGAR